MKIVKIEEPREGFVYESNGLTFVINNNAGTVKLDESEPDVMYCGDKAPVVLGRTPIGALNITHTIKDGKLVEIERRDIEVGDVFMELDGGTLMFISKIKGHKSFYIEDGGIGSCFIPMDWRGYIKDSSEKQGIMSVHWEIDWSVTQQEAKELIGC